MQRYGWQARQAQSMQSQIPPPPVESQKLGASMAVLKGNEKVPSTVNESKNTSNSSMQAQKPSRVTRVSSIDPSPLFQGIDLIPGRRPAPKVEPPKKIENSAVLTLKTQQNDEVVPNLKFQRANKVNEPATKIEKQSWTERQRGVQSMNEPNVNLGHTIEKQMSSQEGQATERSGPRRQLATQRKKYDLFDDVLFPKPKPVSQAGTGSIQSNRQSQATSQLSQKESRAGEQSITPVSSFNQNVGVNQNVPKSRSNIVLFCLQRLFKNRKQANFNYLKEQLKVVSLQRLKRVSLIKLASLFKSKQQDYTSSFLRRLIQLQIKTNVRPPARKTEIIPVEKQVLIKKLLALHDQKIRMSLVRLKWRMNRRSDMLIKVLLRMCNVKILKESFQRIKNNIKGKDRRNLTVNLVFLFSNISYRNLKEVFEKISRSKAVPREDSQLANVQSFVQMNEEQSPPKASKLQSVSSPNIAFSDPSKKTSTERNPPVRKTALNADTQNMRLQKLIETTKKDHENELSNSQLRLEELKQIVSEYNFQLTYKKAKVKELEQISKALPDEGEEISKERPSVTELTRLEALLKVYFAVSRYPEERIDIGWLEGLKEEDSGSDTVSETWIALYDNLAQKKQIEFYESKLEGQDQENQGEKKKTSWTYAYHQHMTIKGLVRNYIKEQYYWAMVRKVVSK